MASRIQGITIEIDGNTTKLQASLKGVDQTLRTTQNNLRDINKLLKLDPGNIELLTQKQKNLKTAIQETKTRLQELKDAQSNVQKGTAEWDALQREIIATEQNLKQLESDYSSFGSVAKQVVKAAADKMRDLSNKIEAAGQKFAPVSKAAAGLVTGMGALGYKAVTTADDINTLAKQTGLSTEEIQKMQYAADLIDVSFDDISGALKKMKPKMTDSNETFQKLGVSIKNADGSLRSADEVFFDTVKALSQIQNETERDQVAMELFGKSADSLAGIIDDGGQALKEYGDEAQRLGMVLSQEELDALNEINDELDKMKANLRGSFLKVGMKIAKAAAPLVEKVAKALEKLAKWLDKLTPEQMKMVGAIASALAVAAPLLIIISKITKGVSLLMSGISLLLTPMGLIVVAIAAVIAIGVLLYKNWDKIKKAANDLKTSIVNAWNNIKTSVSNAINTLKTNITNAWNNIYTSVTTVATNIKTAVSNAWTNMTTAVSTAVNNAKTAITTAWSNIKTSVSTTVSGIQTAVSNAFNGISSSVSTIWGNIKSSITNAINGAKTAVSNAVEAIKKALNFKFQLPSLKLPHISIYYEQADSAVAKFLGISRIPHFSVEWYKKAYDNAMMFTSPTVLATPSGLKGFGDGHGAEIVLGLNKLRELVGSTSGVTINVYAQPGMDVNQLADAIQSRFVAQQKQRSLAYA